MVSNSRSDRKEASKMLNNYDGAELREIGKAQDVILGSKPDDIPFDSDTDLRQVPITDEDE
jgi:hypothetical protein